MTERLVEDPAAEATTEAEALIRAARARQHRRRRVIRVSVAAAILVLGACWYFVADHTGGSRGAEQEQGTKSVAAGAFAGTWHVHTYSLTVRADGQGSFEWPTHNPCAGPGAAPGACDSLVPKTVKLAGRRTTIDEIIDGGHAHLQLISVAGTTANGRITGSTVRSVLPDGPVTLRVTKDDLLRVTTAIKPAMPSFESLCGPKAAALSGPQQRAEGINCGA
ncbi:MAG TPA: hypothetical protein VMU76_09475 [Acidimicrobiales bacterium]|nr:hypothetical protein [Acidimicrobiales bacterium]